jgi:hypothetical protein
MQAGVDSVRGGMAVSVPIALGLLAATAAVAFGFWTGSGQRLPKLEAALGLATLGLVTVAVASLRGPRGPASRARSASGIQLIMFAAALLSMAAALIHLAVIREHLDEYWLYGVFFVVVGVGQMGWAFLALWRPSSLVLWLGAIGNGGVVLFFVITRTIGTLIGPAASEPARLGFGDAMVTGYQVLIVLASLALLGGLAARSRVPFTSRVGAGALIASLLVAQTALALQSSVSSAPFVPPAG